MNNIKVIFLILSISLITAIAYFYLQTEPQSAAPTSSTAISNEPTIIEPAVEQDIIIPVIAIDEEETIVAPQQAIKPRPTIISSPATLEGSDMQVLLAIADLSPVLSQWLTPKEQIRKWVLAIDLIAEGKIPKRYRPVDYPIPAYKVIKKDLESVADIKNEVRMNTIINAITNIPPELAAHYYQQWLPILDKAYSEQGKNDTFSQRFNLAISQVLASSELNSNASLVRPNVLYRYADKNTEQTSDVEKLMWRMGAKNTEKVQDFVRELRFYLNQQQP